MHVEHAAMAPGVSDALLRTLRTAVSGRLLGKVIVIDAEMGYVQDAEGSQFAFTRDGVTPEVFDSLRAGSPVEFSRNALDSVATLRLAAAR